MGRRWGRSVCPMEAFSLPAPQETGTSRRRRGRFRRPVGTLLPGSQPLAGAADRFSQSPPGRSGRSPCPGLERHAPSGRRGGGAAFRGPRCTPPGLGSPPAGGVPAGAVPRFPGEMGTKFVTFPGKAGGNLWLFPGNPTPRGGGFCEKAGNTPFCRISFRYE